MPTLLDIKKIDAGAGYDLIKEAVTALRPELSFIPADTMVETTMELSVLTKLPAVGFRNINEGSAKSKPEFENRVFQCGIIDQAIQADRRAPGLSTNYGKFLSTFSSPFVDGALQTICKQFWYGTTNDKKGFIGLIAQSNPDANHVVDAGGAANVTSAWLMGVGPSKLQWLYGNGESIMLDGRWMEETGYDANGNAFPALTNWVKGRPGIRLANKNCAIRVKNIGTENGKGLTDALLYQALAKARKLGFEANGLLLNPDAHEQWRQSKITALVTAPELPKDFVGIPVYPTNNIINGETI